MTSMAAAACTQRGCGGTIEDGYCTVCGLAPTPASSGASLSAPAASAFSAALAGSASGSASSSVSMSGVSVASLSGSVGTGSRPGSRSSRSGSGRLSRGRLGAGLVEVPSVPAVDPASAVLADPQVPENKRFCGNCGELVGQARDGRPGMTEGFCPHCRTRFSFAPKLAPGELVAGQYEILGCLAHGGLGWIYLARDHNVSDRWVVLKGLLNTGDPDAIEAAVAEGRFLAQVEHPNIVRIFNFVQHTSRSDGETAGYIVMEYVGGKSLKQIRQEARQRRMAVPLAHALAYALEILPALGYLHDRGLVYCDFKPDNVIQTEEQLKLIDLGGVRSIDDDGAIYGTVGYQAPEIETDGPSPSSDLYTVGRTLAVLTFDFAFQGEYKFRLPANEPLLQAQESFARFLRRATNPEPGRRFQSAGEMAEQLTGVLREVLSLADGEPRPAFSGLFSPELRAVGIELTPAGPDAAPPSAAEVIAGLPVPLAEGADPAAGYLATLAGLPPEQQAEALLAAVAGEGGVPPAVAASTETRLALVRALIVAGDVARRRVTWPSSPQPIRPTGGSPGTAACASSPRDGPTGRGRRSAPSTTSFPVSSRPSSRSASRPRRPASLRSRGTTSSSCGRSTGHASAPRSARPGPAWPAATGWRPSPPSPRSRRPPATTPPRRSPRSDCWSPSAARLRRAGPRLRPAVGSRSPTCARPTSAWACSPLTTCAGTSSRWRSCGPRSTGCRPSRPAPGGAAQPRRRAHPRLRAERARAPLRARARLPRARQPGPRSGGTELVDMANSVRPRTWI